MTLPSYSPSVELGKDYAWRAIVRERWPDGRVTYHRAARASSSLPAAIDLATRATQDLAAQTTQHVEAPSPQNQTQGGKPYAPPTAARVPPGRTTRPPAPKPRSRV